VTRACAQVPKPHFADDDSAFVVALVRGANVYHGSTMPIMILYPQQRRGKCIDLVVELGTRKAQHLARKIAKPVSAVAEEQSAGLDPERLDDHLLHRPEVMIHEAPLCADLFGNVPRGKVAVSSVA
jgi:hypothetical protein